MSEESRFEWVSGAAWLLPDGTMEIVPGFHDEWIEKHQDMVPGCGNVVDVVMRLGWVSVVSYSQGYIEFIIRSRSDAESVRLCVEHLSRNQGKWRNALVMTLDEEGYVKLVPKDFGPELSPSSRIRGAFMSGR
jgi:hypothetical protein